MVTPARVADVAEMARVAREVALELDGTLHELGLGAWAVEVRENLVHRLDMIATEASYLQNLIRTSRRH